MRKGMSRPDKWKNPRHLSCPHCKSRRLSKSGFIRGRQRYLCEKCGKTTTIPRGLKRVQKSS